MLRLGVTAADGKRSLELQARLEHQAVVKITSLTPPQDVQAKLLAAHVLHYAYGCAIKQERMKKPPVPAGGHAGLNEMPYRFSF